MKKILKNIFKWLILVLICYSLVFTGITVMEQGGIVEAIAYKIDNPNGDYLENIGSTELEELCKDYQEWADKVMSNVDEEALTESEINKQVKYNELYKKYPSGFTRIIRDISLYNSMSSLHIISLVMGISIGTAIYTMFEKDKKGLKLIISLYVLFVILLGFIEGIQTISGDNLTLLDRWSFPETFISPITAVFIVAIVVRILRQKDIAKKLNIKLEEIRSERIEDKNED